MRSNRIIWEQLLRNPGPSLSPWTIIAPLTQHPLSGPNLGLSREAAYIFQKHYDLFLTHLSPSFTINICTTKKLQIFQADRNSKMLGLKQTIFIFPIALNFNFSKTTQENIKRYRDCDGGGGLGLGGCRIQNLIS